MTGFRSAPSRSPVWHSTNGSFLNFDFIDTYFRIRSHSPADLLAGPQSRRPKATDQANRRCGPGALFEREIQDDYWNFSVHPQLIELGNLTTVARLIVESDLARKEPRGLHAITDYPTKHAVDLKLPLS